ncbi:MAG: gliding motility lipoprotein GldH [Bacteroidales bacterium]|nr:gliding motility lipoprotein GldH [Bacteroidales bacterium]
MNKFSFLFLLLVLLGLSSCKNAFYEKMDSLPDEVWNIDTVLSYEVEITDSLQYYNFYVNIRNTTDFETQNFYIFLTTTFPDGFSARDTLGCVMCDPHGRWTGKGNGRIRENKFLLKPKVRFADKGVYRFDVQQAMRSDNVKGIADFGISIYPYKEK